MVGIGSPHGDDQVGWEIARALEKRALAQAVVRLARTPDDLLDCVDPVRPVMIFDACRGAGAVGSVHRWEWPTAALDEMHWSGTHQISLPGVLALAGQLEQLPASVTIWGVEVAATRPGEALSNEVAEGAKHVVELICQEWGSVCQGQEAGHA